MSDSDPARPIELRTERLLLRPFIESDADDVFAYARLENWSRYLLPRVPYPYSRDDAVEFISRTLSTSWEDEANWAFVLDDRVIGSASLEPLDQAGVAEIGYGLSPEHWGRGLMTEAGDAIVRYAFDVRGFETLVARADVRNAGSWRVMEKLGMSRERVGTREGRDGGEVDEVHYRLERGAWRP